MQSIAEDAERISLLFHYGVVPADEVIAWADSLIVQMDSPPDSLVELATTAVSKTGDIVSYLNRLSSGADFWSAFRSALPQVRDWVASHPERANRIANDLFLTACRFSDVPDDLHFLYRFSDEFSLARSGPYGDPEIVYRDFLKELNNITRA